MLSYKREALPMAEVAAADAQRLTANVTPRERAHVTALLHWIDGDPDHAAAVWEQILVDHPLTCWLSAWRILSISGLDAPT